MAVLELTTFRLRAASAQDEAPFLAADAIAQTGFHNLQPGMLRRTTARGQDGEWLVVVLWYSADAADAAVDAGRNSPELQGFYDHIDAGSVDVRRYATLD